jgi:hypothetical protein
MSVSAMVFRLVFLTLLVFAVVVVAIGFCLKPVAIRAYRHLEALNRRDDEREQDELDYEELRKSALAELDRESRLMAGAETDHPSETLRNL